MAPNAPDTARAPQRQVRRTAPRIVPAIPLALSRVPNSTRPITPEETAAETVTHQDAVPQSSVEAEPKNRAIPDPLTPESKTSVYNNDATEDKALSSSSADAPSASHEIDTPEEVDGNSSIVFQSTFHDHADVAENGSGILTTDQRPRSSKTPDHQPAQLPTQEFAGVHLRSPSVNTFSHDAKSSLDGIVFGSTRKSPSRPSTPHEAEVEIPVQHQQFPHHPPGIAPPAFAPQPYSHHPHYPAVTQSQWTIPTSSAAPLEPFYTHAQDFPPTAFPGQAQYQPTFQDQHSLGNTPVFVNGHVRSQSQSPIKSHLGGTKPSSEQDEDSLAVNYPNEVPGNDADSKMQPFQLRLKEPIELAGYLLSQFAEPEFADYVLRIRSEESLLLSLPVHSIVVARSRTIASAIRNISPSVVRPTSSPIILDIFSRDTFVTPESLNEALKVVYGAVLLPVESILYGLGPFAFEEEQTSMFGEARKRMAQAISYAAAGRFFRMDSMLERGFQLIRVLLRWDTFDQALHFGLDGSSYNQSRSSSFKQATAGTPTTLEEFLANKLLDHYFVDFIAYSFPLHFALYTIAPELRHNPRLLTIVESRAPAHNPRLSRIRFGDVPPEDDLQPDHVTRTLSSALLSLPLPLLDRLFNHRAVVHHLGPARVEKILQEVVGERERRRLKVFGDLSNSVDVQNGSYPKTLLENLMWEERIVRSTEHTSGYTLTEARVADSI